MSKLAELRAQRDELTEAAQTLLRGTGSAKMSVKQQEQFDALSDQIYDLQSQIRAEIRRGEQAAEAFQQASANDWWVDGKPVKALRKAEDIRAHYAPLSGQSADTRNMRLTDFLRGVAGGKTTEAVRAALSEGTDSSGGYLVPSILMPGILEAMVPASACLSAGAAILPFSGPGKSWTYAGIGNLPTAAWRQESGAVSQSDMTFRAVSASPKSLAFYFKVSRELLMDAAGLSEAMSIAISQAFAKELDRVALLGSGTAPEPRGLANLAGVHDASLWENGAQQATHKFNTLLLASQKLLDANAPMPTAAIMSNRSLVGFAQLADSNGQPLQRPEMLQSMRFFGTSQIPNNLTLGTSTDCSSIYCGDFSRMFFAMRESVSIQRVDQLFATTGEIGFICHVRADVLVTYPGAFAVINGVRPLVTS
jgi:HK97 family phage major capsid protein